jgi:hypothetical protein
MTATCTAAKTCLPTLDEAGACMTGVEGMTGEEGEEGEEGETDPISEIGSVCTTDCKPVMDRLGNPDCAASLHLAGGALQSVANLCSPACATESLPDLTTKVTACVASLTNWTHMQCSPACSDMMTAVKASACYTGLSFSSAIPAEMWTTLEQACTLFDTCYEEQMTYQTIVPECQNALGSYDVTTGGCPASCQTYVEGDWTRTRRSGR